MTMDDKFTVFVYLMAHKDPSRRSPELITAHIEHLKRLHAEKRLVMCGPFLDYKGGMGGLRAASLEEARETAEKDPFISSGFEGYELRTWKLGCEENNWLA